MSAAVSLAPRSNARRSPTAGNRGQGGKWLRPSTRRRIYERDQWCCVWCLAKVARQPPLAGPARQASIDHVVARARGGSNEHRNLITSCAGCNAKRGDRNVQAFAAWLCGFAHLKHLARYDEGVRLIVRRVRAAQRRKLPAIILREV